MDNNINIAVWFEIPATHYERAVTFYQTILDVQLEDFEMDGLRQALFPHGNKAHVSGAVVCGEGFKPSPDGCVVYLNGGEDLAVVLSKVEAAGGKVLRPKIHLSDEIGNIAHFMDTEGNRIGIHSMG
ncbi:VOC family protein [Oceanospirillum sanctuarii]|uniref:VOC family protein n=1 Tax=Oceanospirillum sanctuarii TaxID=1434821 RepID=UPI000A3B0A7A|nr:VOC family protein [Oceanospirillum sanctuarii]